LVFPSPAAPNRDPVRRGELIAAGGLLFDLLSRPMGMPARGAHRQAPALRKISDNIIWSL
jgi:hypothetical protein